MTVMFKSARRIDVDIAAQAGLVQKQLLEIARRLRELRRILRQHLSLAREVAAQAQEGGRADGLGDMRQLFDCGLQLIDGQQRLRLGRCRPRQVDPDVSHVDVADVIAKPQQIAAQR